jgi:DNA-binding NarL/FixJ family response regulator
MRPAFRIAVVEDDVELRDMLVGLLEDLDHEVVVARGDAIDLVGVCRTAGPDVVILDQRLPHVSGLDAAARLKAEFPDLPVIMLSAYDDRSLQEAAVAIGVSSYLVKGCTASELDHAIRTSSRS